MKLCRKIPMFVGRESRWNQDVEVKNVVPQLWCSLDLDSNGVAFWGSAYWAPFGNGTWPWKTTPLKVDDLLEAMASSMIFDSKLVGGLEHFLCFHILGMSSSQLANIFQRAWNQQPVRCCGKKYRRVAFFNMAMASICFHDVTWKLSLLEAQDCRSRMNVTCALEF